MKKICKSERISYIDYQMETNGGIIQNRTDVTLLETISLPNITTGMDETMVIK
jgi:hypothetical protein